METLVKKLAPVISPELRLSLFFEAFVNFYLDNPGWFCLIWQEYIGDQRPKRHIEATESTNKRLNQYIAEIWEELTGKKPDVKRTKRVLHNTHCYIIGEVSNFLLGRGLIENETRLKTYVANEAVHMFQLCLKGA